MEHGDHREIIDDHSEHPHGFDTTEPKGGFIAIFGIATIVTLVVTILGIQYYFDQAYEQQVHTEVLVPESDQLKNLHAAEDTQLYSYQYVDRAQGTVRLTIDRAMDLLATEAAENRLTYSSKPYAVKTPEQLAAGPAATAAPGAPGAKPNPAPQGATTPHATPAPPVK
jgi:hypothetical protein